MTLSTYFPQLKTLDPFVIGFDKLFDQLQEVSSNVAKNAPNWPPYNIKQVNDNKYVIEMAVAGFGKSDIEVTLEGNKLVIKGATKDDEDKNYIWKGIANRSFQRVFTLNDQIEIKDAEIANGMLKVWLQNMYQAQQNIKKITIKDKEEK
jgi:molecular chaperone IbpA